MTVVEPAGDARALLDFLRHVRNASEVAARCGLWGNTLTSACNVVVDSFERCGVRQDF